MRLQMLPGPGPGRLGLKHCYTPLYGGGCKVPGSGTGRLERIRQKAIVFRSGVARAWQGRVGLNLGTTEDFSGAGWLPWPEMAARLEIPDATLRSLLIQVTLARQMRPGLKCNIAPLV